MAHRLRFARALRLIRQSKGISQEDFSNSSSRTYISSLERGLKSPTLGKIEEIAAVLSVHPLTLIAMSYLPTSDSEQLKALIVLVEVEIKSINSRPLKPSERIRSRVRKTAKGHASP